MMNPCSEAALEVDVNMSYSVTMRVLLVVTLPQSYPSCEV